MDKELNILVQSSDYYAPFAGVMLTSLFENNLHLERITVYLMTADMSEKNRTRFHTLFQKYKRTLKFIDATEIDKLLEENHVPKYNNSFAAYYKIFAVSFIKEEIERLLYLDSDVLVNGSLSELTDYNLQGHILGMCIETQPERYKKVINCSALFYYNTGVILFDVKKWISDHCMEKVIEHIKTVRAMYPIADQDLLNVVFPNEIATIPQRYNLHTAALIFKDYNFFLAAYGLKSYYSEQEFYESAKNPVILHYLGPFHTKPWFEDGTIPAKDWPAKDLWRQYLALSPWSDFVPLKHNIPFLSKAQHVLFKILPARLFTFIHRSVWELRAWIQVKKMERQ